MNVNDVLIQARQRRDRLWREYNQAQARWESYIRPDPDLLAESEEAQRLHHIAAAAFDAYSEQSIGVLRMQA